jgi:hypothetical protein
MLILQLRMNLTKDLNSFVKKLISDNLKIYRCFFTFIIPFIILSKFGYANSETEVIETAFIYQFPNYIEWPSSFAKEDKFIISVLDDPSLFQYVERLAKKKNQINGHSIVVTSDDSSESISKSHIVFLGSRSTPYLKKVLGIIKNLPVLLITRSNGFAQIGSSINFFIENDRVRFEINRKELAGKGFQINSQLLNLAKIVDTDTQ